MTPQFQPQDMQVNGQPVPSPTTYAQANVQTERTWVPNPSTCQGRLTLSTGVPVPTADVLAATTLYFTPYQGNRVCTYDDPAAPLVGTGGNWLLWACPEISVTLAALLVNRPYDVFLQQVAGVLGLSLVAWTNGTTRATALVLQDGVYVLTGVVSKRYLGTICITGTVGQCEDSVANRLVWNAQNRVRRKLAVLDNSGANWNYTTAVWRSADANATYRVNFVYGLSAEPVEASVFVPAVSNTGSATFAVGLGLDSTAVNSADQFGGQVNNTIAPATATLRTIPAVGSHFLQWLEISQAAGTTTWSLGSAAMGQAGITGVILA